MNQVELTLIIDKLDSLYDKLYEKDLIEEADEVGYIIDDLKETLPFLEKGY